MVQTLKAYIQERTITGSPSAYRPHSMVGLPQVVDRLHRALSGDESALAE